MQIALLLTALCLSACAPAEPPSEPTPAPAPAPITPGKGERGKQGKSKAPAQEKIPVQIFLVDQAKYAAGQPDAIVAVERKVAKNNPPRNALWFLWKGPNPKEKEQGLTLVPSGTTGFETLKISDGVAHVTLKEGCDAGGATLTIYDLVVPTLKQFDEVQHVKVYSADGKTADPSGATDSRPACLEP